jgi:hypothetical protein
LNLFNLIVLFYNFVIFFSAFFYISFSFSFLTFNTVDQPKFKAPSAPAAAAAVEENLYVSPLSVDEKVAIALSVGEETLTVDELKALYAARPHPIVYDGFEPSGRMHIAQGVMRAINVNKLTSTGCLFKFWVADWFAQLNNKMDGDLKKIRMVGQYMIEIWKAIGTLQRSSVIFADAAVVDDDDDGGCSSLSV